MIAIPTLDYLVDALTGFDFSDVSQAKMRQCFEPLRLTFCLDDEMLAEPYRECGGFNLYLVYSGGHCLSLTDDPEIASAVVVAEVDL